MPLRWKRAWDLLYQNMVNLDLTFLPLFFFSLQTLCLCCIPLTLTASLWMEELAKCENAGPISCTSITFNFLICQKMRDPAIYINLDYGPIQLEGNIYDTIFIGTSLTSFAENIGGVDKNTFLKILHTGDTNSLDRCR